MTDAIMDGVVIEPAAQRRRRALKLSLVEGMMQAVLIGVCESYLGALAVELGHGPTALAVLITVPPLLGGLSQLAVSPLVRWLGSRKRLVVSGAALQAVATLMLGACAMLGVQEILPLLLAKILFWVSGLVIAPAWGAWMAVLTADGGRERYFSRRQGLIQVPLLMSFVVSGFWLAEVLPGEKTRETLALLCAVGAAFRFGSAALLAVQPDEPPDAEAQASVFANAVQAIRESSWRPVVYVAVLMMAANVAVPFFTPFALRELDLGYGTFAWLMGASILAKAIVSPVYYSIGNRLGLVKVVAISGVGISVVPIIWGVTTSVPTLFAAQILSGIAWGGLEFGSYQLLLQGASERVRIEFLSVANTVIATAQVLGGIFGSQLVELLELSYADLFIWSGILRALAALVLVRSIPKRLAPLVRLVMRVISLRPAGGSVARPIVLPR